MQKDAEYEVLEIALQKVKKDRNNKAVVTKEEIIEFFEDGIDDYEDDIHSLARALMGFQVKTDNGNLSLIAECSYKSDTLEIIFRKESLQVLLKE